METSCVHGIYQLDLEQWNLTNLQFQLVVCERFVFGYLKVGHAIFRLHDNAPPATLPAIWRANVLWTYAVRESYTIHCCTRRIIEKKGIEMMSKIKKGRIFNQKLMCDLKHGIWWLFSLCFYSLWLNQRGEISINHKLTESIETTGLLIRWRKVGLNWVQFEKRRTITVMHRYVNNPTFSWCVHTQTRPELVANYSVIFILKRFFGVETTKNRCRAHLGCVARYIPKLSSVVGDNSSGSEHCFRVF